MTRARALFACFWLIFLSACAPVMLGRTPTPAAPGETKLSTSASYPVGLTALPTDVDSIGPDPAYWPLPLPLTFQIAYGRSETLETNVGLMVSPGLKGAVASGQSYGVFNIGARYGVKNRFQEEPVELAFDYGASVYAPYIALGADAGILAAVPLGEAKLYGGLRGFSSFSVVGPRNLGGAATLTVGGEVPLERGQSVRLELTFLTNLYNGADYLVTDPVNPSANAPQGIGFSLVPAISFSF